VDETDESLAFALKALGHPKRIRLLRFLTEARTLEDISGDLKVARQSAQEHLDRLVKIGLVGVRHGRGAHGPVTRYQVNVPRLFDVYDRLGTRLGLLAAELEEDVRGSQATAVLAARSSPKPMESPRLIIVHGMRVGQTIPLQGDGPWLIGRDPAAAMGLDYDPYVSHRHAEVRRTRNGFELADALSSNGVAVDWHPVPRGGVVPLANGSLLRAGKTLLLFRIT
jgi:DNA-binding transcriptional ArsR family regulator